MIRVSVMMHIVYKNIRSFFTQLINVNNQDFVAVIESLNALLMKTMEKTALGKFGEQSAYTQCISHEGWKRHLWQTFHSQIIREQLLF